MQQHCQECGEPFTAKKHHAKFCSTSCRKTWNNRRAMRGAQLYDAVMAMRYDRKKAKALAKKIKVGKSGRTISDADRKKVKGMAKMKKAKGMAEMKGMAKMKGFKGNY